MAKLNKRNLGRRGATIVMRQAAKYAQDPGELRGLVDRASLKASRVRGLLEEVWGELMLLFRLLKAYASGRYRHISWTSLLRAVAAVFYFLLPFDLIPDFIPVGGYFDDAAVIVWVVASIRDDLARFRAWEEGEGEDGDDPAPAPGRLPA